jgi:type II secretory pathway pseudopilin PulG
MIVVAIVAILVAVAIVAYTRHVKKARIVDGRSFLSTIQARQEAYFQRFGYYCNPSSAEPQLVDGEEPRAKQWAPAAGTGWQDLGARPPSDMSYFEYTVVAGVPSVGTPTTYPASGLSGALGIPAVNQPWYYAYGRANLDGSDGNNNCAAAAPPAGAGCTIVWTTSARNEIVTINEGE